MKKILSGLVFLFFTLIFVPQTFAHVTVKPAQIGVGERTNFVVSVPTEEDVPTTQVRLVIPEGMKSVRPNVAPGWNIQVIKTGEGEAQRVSEVIWSGGSIPADQRNEFVFSAQAPSNETELSWKAYQTYANGVVVAWDTDPKTISDTHDENAPKPYSVTKVVNDLVSSPEPTKVKAISEKKDFSVTTLLSIIAILISSTAIYLQLKSKKK